MDKPDRRVRRTQDALRHAMMELILEKGFEATSVSEITDRADVGRSTFYAHYADKEDLLQGSLEGLGAHLRERMAVAIDEAKSDVHPALTFCLPMLEHAGENRDLFAAMAGRRSGALFLELTHDLWADLVRANWKNSDEVAVQAIAGGFSAVLQWWLEKSPDLKPSEVERRFRAVVEPALG